MERRRESMLPRMTRMGFRALAALVCLLATTAAAWADGDVLVTIDKSRALRLDGDDLSNEVQVDRDPITKEFVVRGRNGTTVNGVEILRMPNAPTISADLRGGDDKLALGGFRLRRRIVVDLGDGNDELSFLRVRTGGRVRVDAGLGDDTVRIEGGSDFTGRLDVLTSDGIDLVRVADSVLRGAARIVTGNGNDQVEIHRNGLTHGASLRIETGEDDDFVDLLGNTVQAGGRIATAAGADVVRITTTRFREDLSVLAGSDDDDVSIDRATFDERLLVRGGDGTNRVFLGAGVINSGGLTAGASGCSDNFCWWVVIIHVF